MLLTSCPKPHRLGESRFEADVYKVKLEEMRMRSGDLRRCTWRVQELAECLCKST